MGAIGGRIDVTKYFDKWSAFMIVLACADTEIIRAGDDRFSQHH